MLLPSLWHNSTLWWNNFQISFCSFSSAVMPFMTPLPFILYYHQYHHLHHCQHIIPYNRYYHDWYILCD
jgi:hypothetical protein